jgi:CRISPR system Cascade subunit CasD
MIDALLLRLDAPLISFGGVAIDNIGVTQRFPGRAMLTGLLANALGWAHADADNLQPLQARIRYAARCDRAGRAIVDYQTVDLGQDFLKEGWTTRGAVEGRGGDPKNREGTHIRYRHYLADAVYTLALSLAPVHDSPTLDEVEAALREPARPLFIGRKCCLPSVPLLLGRTSAETLLRALEAQPRAERADATGPLSAWWPADEDTDRPGRLIPITDDRDWTNQIHVGRRWMHEGTING